jgi:hypothetical protein
MDAALHVLRYLRGTYDQAILYQHVDTLADTLWGWVDSDWAADVDSRRSHTGYIIMINGGAVSWKSRRQDCVSLSTSETEYVAASQCGQEVYLYREKMATPLVGYRLSAVHEDVGLGGQTALIWLEEECPFPRDAGGFIEPNKTVNKFLPTWNKFRTWGFTALLPSRSYITYNIEYGIWSMEYGV